MPAALDYVRTQVALRFLDAVTTAPLRPKRGLGACLRTVWSPRSSNYDRTGSVVQLIDALLPGAARRASGLLRRGTRLPFRAPLGARPLELAGYGSGATVYALGDGAGRRALKVYRRSLARSPDGLIAIAAEYRAQHERIRAWYADLPRLVPRTEFLVLHGPLLGLRAACGVQDWIPESRRDLFTALAEGGWDEALRPELVSFARRTLELWTTEGVSVDLLGEGNLVVADDGDGPELRLLDGGILQLAGPDDPRRSRLASMATLATLLEHDGAAEER